MNIAKTTLLWWSFFMPRRLAYIILIYTSLTQSSFSQDILSIINDEQTNHLYFICNDIYKYTRNPMYLGLLIIYLSTIILFQNFLGFLLVPAFILYINYFQEIFLKI